MYAEGQELGVESIRVDGVKHEDEDDDKDTGTFTSTMMKKTTFPM